MAVMGACAVVLEAAVVRIGCKEVAFGILPLWSNESNGRLLAED